MRNTDDEFISKSWTHHTWFLFVFLRVATTWCFVKLERREGSQGLCWRRSPWLIQLERSVERGRNEEMTLWAQRYGFRFVGGYAIEVMNNCVRLCKVNWNLLRSTLATTSSSLDMKEWIVAVASLRTAVEVWTTGRVFLLLSNENKHQSVMANEWDAKDESSAGWMLDKALHSRLRCRGGDWYWYLVLVPGTR